MEFMTPKELMHKHYELFIFSFLLFLIGCFIGTTPKYAESIIEQAKKEAVVPTDLYRNFQLIFGTNGFIAIFLWSGWFIFPFIITAFPLIMMVRNVGFAFGAVAYALSLPNLILVLFIFGILEALGFIWAFAGGLMLMKMFYLKLRGSTKTWSELFGDSFMMFMHAFMLLLVAAIFETLLLYGTVLCFLGVAFTIALIVYLVKGN